MRSFDASLSGPLVEIDEIPEPEVSGPYDVVVRIAGAGVCRTELHIIRGEMDTRLPHVLGHENAGFVHEIGDGVTTVSIGDPVLVYPFLASGLSDAERRGVDSAAPSRVTPGIDAQGGFAQYLMATERAMVALPPGTDPTPLAPLTDAGLAAYRACTKISVAPGDTVVVVGAGGLGHLAIQILRATTPARVVALDTRPEARQLAVRCGAHAAVTPEEVEPGAAAVLDFVGSDDSIRLGLRSLRFGGHLVAVGVGGTVAVPVVDVVTSEHTIEGVYVGTYSDLVEVARLALDGVVTPEVVRYSLDDAAAALRDLADGAVTGRAVLIP